MSQALKGWLNGALRGLLSVVLLSLLWSTSGFAHSGHAHALSSQSEVGTSVGLVNAAHAEKVMIAATSTEFKARLNPSALQQASGEARGSAWAEARNREDCLANCPSGCSDCDCHACKRNCSAGDSCFLSCASVHSALISEGVSTPGESATVRLVLPTTDRTDGRTLSPDPPPPKL